MPALDALERRRLGGRSYDNAGGLGDRPQRRGPRHHDLVAGELLEEAILAVRGVAHGGQLKALCEHIQVYSARDSRTASGGHRQTATPRACARHVRTEPSAGTSGAALAVAPERVADSP